MKWLKDHIKEYTERAYEFLTQRKNELNLFSAKDMYDSQLQREAAEVVFGDPDANLFGINDKYDLDRVLYFEDDIPKTFASIIEHNPFSQATRYLAEIAGVDVVKLMKKHLPNVQHHILHTGKRGNILIGNAAGTENLLKTLFVDVKVGNPFYEGEVDCLISLDHDTKLPFDHVMHLDGSFSVYKGNGHTADRIAFSLQNGLYDVYTMELKNRRLILIMGTQL